MPDGDGFNGVLPPSQPRHVLRVLIVDDNAADRELTLRWLSQIWPFEHELAVVQATNGDEALERMLRTRLSLVVLDWTMPGMDGGELLQRMRKYGIDLPVVVLSGLEHNDVPLDLEALAAVFLNKNEIDTFRFENAIARALLLKERLVAARTGAAAALPAEGELPRRATSPVQTAA